MQQLTYTRSAFNSGLTMHVVMPYSDLRSDNTGYTDVPYEMSMGPTNMTLYKDYPLPFPLSIAQHFLMVGKAFLQVSRTIHTQINAV